MTNRPILLVEDNPDDETLTIRALKKHNIKNEIIVAHDGVEAIDYLFGTGPFAGRVSALAISPNFDGAGTPALYQGTASGGVWRSTDFTAGTPTWVP